MRKLLQIEPESFLFTDKTAVCVNTMLKTRTSKFMSRDELLDTCASHLTSVNEFNRLLEVLQIRVTKLRFQKMRKFSKFLT